MKAQALGLAAISLLFLPGSDCCGVGVPALVMEGHVQYRCYDVGECPVAVGAQLIVQAYPELVMVDASLDKPSLAQLELVNGGLELRVRPTAPGTAKLSATIDDESVLAAPLVFAERVTTRVTPMTNIKYRSDSAETPQVFAGTAFTVFAEHRDAADRPLVGSGLETWSITGGSFSGGEASLVRQVQTGTDPKLVVSARLDGVPLEVDVVPAGSTAHLDLQARTRQRDGGQFSISWGVTTRLYVSAFSANERFIYGVPAGGELTATTDNAEIATAQLGGDKTIEVYGRAQGSTVLTVGFDGITRSFRIDVE